MQQYFSCHKSHNYTCLLTKNKALQNSMIAANVEQL